MDKVNFTLDLNLMEEFFSYAKKLKIDKMSEISTLSNIKIELDIIHNCKLTITNLNNFIVFNNNNVYDIENTFFVNYALFFNVLSNMPKFGIVECELLNDKLTLIDNKSKEFYTLDILVNTSNEYPVSPEKKEFLFNTDSNEFKKNNSSIRIYLKR